MEGDLQAMTDIQITLITAAGILMILAVIAIVAAALALIRRDT